MSPITQWVGDDPATEFTISVETAPVVSKWWVYVDFTKDDKRDLIFFHRRVGTTLYYYRMNRDLDSNGTYASTHEKWAYLQLNDVDKWIDREFDVSDDLWYIEQLWTTKLKIYWWTVYYSWVQKTIADSAYLTPADGTWYAVLDFSDDTVKLVAAVDYDKHLWFSTIIVASSAITSITNQKWEQLHRNKTTLDGFLKDSGWIKYNTFWVWDVVWPWSSTDNNIVTMDGATGKRVKDSSKSISIDWTLASNSDGKVPTEKAVKTYADTKIPKATDVISINDTGIADGHFVMFNKTNKDLRTASLLLTTSVWSPWLDTNIPTEKAIRTALWAKLDTLAFTDTAVTGKLITGFSSWAWAVAATDTILQAINKLDGNIGTKQNTLTFGIADTNKVQINSADVADNDYAKFTATGLEWRSYSEVLSDIWALPIAWGTMTGKIVEAGRTEVAKTYTPATWSQTVTIDCSVNNMHVVTGHANWTAITFAITWDTNNQCFIISILQWSGTVSTISSWFSTIRRAWGLPPTLTATLNKRDTFWFIRTGINTYDWFVIGQNC